MVHRYFYDWRRKLHQLRGLLIVAQEKDRYSPTEIVIFHLFIHFFHIIWYLQWFAACMLFTKCVERITLHMIIIIHFKVKFFYPAWSWFDVLGAPYTTVENSNIAWNTKFSVYRRIVLYSNTKNCLRNYCNFHHNRVLKKKIWIIIRHY